MKAPPDRPSIKAMPECFCCSSQPEYSRRKVTRNMRHSDTVQQTRADTSASDTNGPMHQLELCLLGVVEQHGRHRANFAAHDARSRCDAAELCTHMSISTKHAPVMVPAISMPSWSKEREREKKKKNKRKMNRKEKEDENEEEKGRN